MFDVPSNSALALRQLEGEKNISELGIHLNYNDLDNNFTPTNGLLLKLSQDFAGLGGDVKYLRNEFQGELLY